MTQTVNQTDQSTAATTRPTTNPSGPADTSSVRQSRLTSDEGKITVAEGVVLKIAGMACREVSGVHSMGSGSGTSRAYGAIRERIPGSAGPSMAQGVGVEVGETEAAIDLDIVVEYGVSISELARGVQRNVKTAIEQMTGLNVVEVNVSVNDIQLPDTDTADTDTDTDTGARGTDSPAESRSS
jgi:uncharacterized alkaline shock family protein YloU